MANDSYNYNKMTEPREDFTGEDASSTMNINADENQSGSSHLNEPITDSETDKLKAEILELKDKYIRQAAEFDNFRKRSAKERLELIQTASREVMVSLLSVLDDSERAEKQMDSSEDIAAIRQGVKLVFNKLRNTLSAKGLRPMQSIGEDFNPDQHEAITEVPAPTENMKGKVVDEMDKGYYLGEKIIRFAKVVVGK
ncbi:MAG TPA: nucleotide exchange factor GrpE [Flavitalea sp.]|nr:nucleotide exchange factor GrpE [Flavitalea sp.]